jgi:hypothetical protein
MPARVLEPTRYVATRERVERGKSERAVRPKTMTWVRRKTRGATYVNACCAEL